MEQFTAGPDQGQVYDQAAIDAENAIACRVLYLIELAAESRLNCLRVVVAHIQDGRNRRQVARFLQAVETHLKYAAEDERIDEIVDMAVSEMRDEDAELVTA